MFYMFASFDTPDFYEWEIKRRMNPRETTEPLRIVFLDGPGFGTIGLINHCVLVLEGWLQSYEAYLQLWSEEQEGVWRWACTLYF